MYEQKEIPGRCVLFGSLALKGTQIWMQFLIANLPFSPFFHGQGEFPTVDKN